ncbi:hypothetical protein HG530_015438 [Fusarium avenaceum]|nr:hypothetical protein HG530_015438 [Fusarium avenaceum]
MKSSSLSECGILKRLDFKHDSDIGWQVKTFTIGKREQLVVIEYTVQVLNPFRIDITIKDDPMSLGVLATEVIDNFAEDAGEKTIEFVHDKMALSSQGPDRILQCLKVGGDILHAGEAIGFNGHHNIDVGFDQLGCNCFSDTLHNDLRLNNVFSAETTITQTSTLQTTRTDQDTLQGTQAEIVVSLLRQLARALVEEGNCVLGELLGLVETLGVKHNLGDKLLVRLRHGHAAEKLLQVVGQVGTAGIARVHGNKDTSVFVDVKLTTYQLNLRLVILDTLLKTQLDILDLLRNSGQDSLLQTVELVETAPSANLADTEEDTAHGLEIEGVVTAEDKIEFGIRHLDVKAVQKLALWVVDITHLQLPKIMSCGIGIGVDKLLDGVTLVDAFGNQLFALLPQNDLEFSKDSVSKYTKNFYLALKEHLQSVTTSGK